MLKNISIILKRSAIAALGLMAFAAVSGSALAAIPPAPVLVDGHLDLGGTDGYTNSMSASVDWFNDHHSSLGVDQTTVYWLEDSAYGLYVYMEASLAAKNMIWGTGETAAELDLYWQGWCDAGADDKCTHHSKNGGTGSSTNSGNEQLVLDYDRMTKMEKVKVKNVLEGD